MRTDPQTMEEGFEYAEHHKGSAILQKFSDVDDKSKSLKNLKSAEYLRNKRLLAERGGQPRGNLADQIMQVHRQLYENPYVKRIVYDKDTDAPTIYLYSEEMLDDLRNHIGDESLQPITIGLDRTFDLR